MKIGLALSLIFNIFLTYHYFSRNISTTSDINVIEKRRDAKAKAKVNGEETHHMVSEIASGDKKSSKKAINTDQIDFEPAITDDEYSFRHAQAEMDQAKRDFYIKVEVPPEAIIKQKELIAE